MLTPDVSLAAADGTTSHRRPLPGWRPGSGAVTARLEDGRTVLVAARAESPLRFVRPTFHGTRSAAVCLVTFGGGLVDGDEVDVELDVGPGATLVVFTQSSTKVFRGAARQALRAKVAGTLVLLPDPVAAFRDARYSQRVEIDLTATGSCVVLDGFNAGRPAFGDRWAMRTLDLRTVVRSDGRTVVTDAMHLDTTDGPIAERMGAFDAYATLIAVGKGALPVVDAVARAPATPPNAEEIVAASPLPRAASLGLPGAVLRVAAASAPRALAIVRSRLRNLPDIDAVDPFASRY